MHLNLDTSTTSPSSAAFPRERRPLFLLHRPSTQFPLLFLDLIFIHSLPSHDVDDNNRLSLSANELNSIEFNFDPRYLIDQGRSNPSHRIPSHYNPLSATDTFVSLLLLLLRRTELSTASLRFSSSYPLQSYPTGSPSSASSATAAAATAAASTAGVRPGTNLIRQPSYLNAVRSTNPGDQPDFGEFIV